MGGHTSSAQPGSLCWETPAPGAPESLVSWRPWVWQGRTSVGWDQWDVWGNGVMKLKAPARERDSGPHSPRTQSAWVCASELGTCPWRTPEGHGGKQGVPRQMASDVSSCPTAHHWLCSWGPLAVSRRSGRETLLEETLGWQTTGHRRLGLWSPLLRNGDDLDTFCAGVLCVSF